jgi:hypothetical protein
MLWDLLGDSKTGQQPETTSADANKANPATASTTSADAQECDYEKNCTPLYGYIEAAVQDSDWDPIIKFLDTGYWPNGGLFQDTFTPAQQSRTWVTRFDPSDRTKVRWSQLPLHLAIVCNAPFAVVGRLIEMYPQAVRCTDDQRMLPLHLALRHNGSDDVVAYLLMQFPESVNAKGKDGRLPIVCALRAPSKVRGKILEIFLKKTKAKNKLALGGTGTDVEKEISSLKTQLEAKTLSLDNAQSKIEALETMRVEQETELSNKEEELDELRNEHAKSTKAALIERSDKKLVEELALQKRIETLEEEKKQAQEEERKARGAEASLRKELESVSKAVSATSPEELNKLKNEIEHLKLNRLEQSREHAQEQIGFLKIELEKTMKVSETKTDTELRAMQHTVTELRKAAIDTRTNDELNSLREEVDHLRIELREREEASRTKNELEEMRQTMESDLKNAAGKTQEELSALKRAVASMHVNELETKTAGELVTLKKELEAVKKEMQENELAYKTQQDVIELKKALEKELKEAKGATFKELAITKKTLDTIQEDLLQGRSSEDLLALRREVDNLKAEVKEKEQTSNLRTEMLELRKALESEMKNSEGKTRRDLAYLKKAVKSLDENSIQVLSFDELSVQKGELASLKQGWDRKDKAAKTREEIDELKKSLEENSKAWEGKNKDDMSVMEDKLEVMSVQPIESKNSFELKTIKAELKSLRQEVKSAEDATKTKNELDALKLTLEEALKSSEGKTADELRAMKSAVDSINVEQLEIQNKGEWDMIRSELNALKDDLKTKEAGEGLLKKEIEDLKANIPKESDKKKKKAWTRVFSRFRRSKDDIGGKDENGSAATSIVTSPSANTETDVTNHTKYSDDDDDVRTIGPPSVHHKMDESIAESSGDEDEEEMSLGSGAASKKSTRSAKSFKSTRSSRTAPPRSSAGETLKTWTSMPAHVKSNKSTVEPVPEEEDDDASTSMLSRFSKKSMKSTKSAKSMKSSKTSDTRASAQTKSTVKTSQTRGTAKSSLSKSTPTISYNQATKAAIAAHQVDVDPETGEMIYNDFREEKKADDAVSI